MRFIIEILCIIISLPAFGGCPSDFNSALNRLNYCEIPGERFWNGGIQRHAEECEAVLGPLPQKIDCTEHKGRFSQAKKIPSTMSSHATMLAGPERTPTDLILGEYSVGPVKWVYSCEKATKITGDNSYALIGLIGYNPNTGESCFFANAERVKEEISGPPGNLLKEGALRSTRDPEYENSHQWADPMGFGPDKCIACHAKGYPFLVSTYLNQSRLGGDGTMDFIPEKNPSAGYRVIGSFFATDDRAFGSKKWDLSINKALEPRMPDGTLDKTCTGCHPIPDGDKYHNLVFRAMNVTPALSKEKSPFTPFMPPNEHFTKDNAEVSYAAWRRIRDAVRKKYYSKDKIYGPCPPPDPITGLFQVSAPDEKGVQVARWDYSDDYNKKSEVAFRRDIQFKAKIKGSDGTDCSLTNLVGNSLRVPTKKGVQYSVEITPIRHCFDYSGTIESQSSSGFLLDPTQEKTVPHTTSNDRHFKKSD